MHTQIYVYNTGQIPIRSANGIHRYTYVTHGQLPIPVHTQIYVCNTGQIPIPSANAYTDIRM